FKPSLLLFIQAEDGIRDFHVTGVQTCALPIYQADGTYQLTVRDYSLDGSYLQQVEVGQWGISGPVYFTIMKGWQDGPRFKPANRSEERRVGQECSIRCLRYQY